MPLYEYTCGNCGEEFEELVGSNTPDAEIECPACEREGVAVRKLSTFATSGSGLGSYGGSASSAPVSSGFS